MGSLFIMISALGFSTLGLFGTMAYEAGFTRNQMLAYRFALAVPMMAIILALAKIRLKANRFFQAFILGAVGIGVEATLYFLTLERLGAALAGIFLYLYPSFVALISYFLRSEKISARQWFAIFLALLGCILVAGRLSAEHDFWGIVFGIATGAWYAVYLLWGNRLSQKESGLGISFGIITGAAFIFSVVSLIEAKSSEVALRGIRSGGDLYALIGLALLASVLPISTLYAGMKRVGPVAASILSTLEMVFTILLAAIFLHESLSLLQILGAACIFTSVVMGSRRLN